MHLPRIIRVMHVGHDAVRSEVSLFWVVQGGLGLSTASAATEGGGFRDALSRFLEHHKLPRGPYVECETEFTAQRAYVLVGANLFNACGVAL